MSLNAKLQKLERLAATKDTPEDHAAVHERFQRECDEWQARFIAGEDAPPPTPPWPWAWPDREAHAHTLRSGAIVWARVNGIVAADAYLPHATADEKLQADRTWQALMAYADDVAAAGLLDEEPDDAKSETVAAAPAAAAETAG